MEPYLYFGGLRKLVKDLKGDEVIHLGIRPYGFHAGNALALIVYPYLLCKYLKSEGKDLRLRFIYSINDYEQDCLDGPDPRKYLFNVYPKNSSLQFMPDEFGCHESITEHWQPIIEDEIKRLKKDYPGISIGFIRNSALKGQAPFDSLLLETIRNPKSQAEIFKRYSGREVLDSPLQYAGIICKRCKKAHGKTLHLGDDLLEWRCEDCGFAVMDHFNNFDYWWYHKPLLLARMKIFKIDVTISGGDHFSEGDFNIRKAFIDMYSPEVKEPRMLFTPTVLALDGQKMSKSRNNTASADMESLIAAADGFMGGELQIDNELIIQKNHEKEYCDIF